MDGWWSEIDGDVRAILERSGPTSPRDFARQLTPYASSPLTEDRDFPLRRVQSRPREG